MHDDRHAYGRVSGGWPDDGRTPGSADRCRPPACGPDRTGRAGAERLPAAAGHALAELGYVAFAFEHNGGRWFDDPAEMLAYLTPLLADPGRMPAMGRAALDVVRAEPRTDPERIAAVGYGTGGAIVLELGRDIMALLDECVPVARE
ncbi:dienelactone hydrolase family protein [Rhodococcus sp. NPDC058639]|uniref:dienelactone hydrolase family protein n=1 Tax=Rhodococcus sp. NPDC058639 TaxID=3346570 RepID=UPI00364E6F2E